MKKYIKRIWYLTAIPVAFCLIAYRILDDIFSGRVDCESWCYWK